MVRKRASLPAILSILGIVPMLLSAAPARAASPLADDAAVLWEWISRTIATVARCADHDIERREQHLDVMEAYFNEVKDAQEKIESVLVQDAIRSGSRNPARETAKRMDDAIVKARATVDEQNQGHDIRFIKNVCKGLYDEYRTDTARFIPLAERFPGAAKALNLTVP